MDVYYFKRYSKYVLDKDAISLFLTIKGCREGCLISIKSRHKNSFLRILTFYRINYVIKERVKSFDFLVSKKPISDDVKKIYEKPDFSEDYFILLGRFLGYPYPMNFRKKLDNNKVGSVKFNFIPNREVSRDEKKKENIYIYRIPNHKINEELLKKEKNTVKRYKRCIKKYLSELYPHFMIELLIQTSS